MKESDYKQLRVLIGDFKKGHQKVLIGDSKKRHQEVFNKILTLLDPTIELILNKYHCNQAIERNDLKQEAIIAVLKAIPKYDSLKNENPVPYFGKCIKNKIKSFLSKNKTEISIQQKIETFSKKFKDEHSKWPSESDIIEGAKLSKNVVQHYLKSLNQSSSSDVKDSSYSNCILGFAKNQIAINLEKKIGTLRAAGFNDEELKIFELKFSSEDENITTNIEIARELNITESKVQRTIKNAEKLLKKQLPKEKNNISEKSKITSTKKRKSNSQTTKDKNRRKPKEIRTIRSICEALYELNENYFDKLDYFGNGRFNIRVNAEVIICFNSNGTMKCECSVDEDEISNKLPDIKRQLRFSDRFATEKIFNQDWKDPIYISNLPYTFNLERFVIDYAPSATKKQMENLLKELGVYDKTGRKYIYRYKNKFKQESNSSNTIK